MPAVRRLARSCLPALGALLLAGCGAGLITGIAASDRGNDAPEARVPELTLSPLMPLVPLAGQRRNVVVANAQIAAAARLRVRIEAAGAGVDQLEPSASGQGGSTLITFTLATGPIVAAVGDATAADVPGRLLVLVDDRPVAASVPIVLARQPRAELVTEVGATERFLSPLGERVRMRVDGLRATAVGDVQLLVRTPDPAAVVQPGKPVPRIVRVGSDLRFEPPELGVPVVSAFLPGNGFPVRAELVVEDAIAGRSTTVTNAYYRPDITLALPGQGPATGGTLVTLIGTALAPFDFTAGGPAGFDFAAVTLSFRKGGRTIELAPQDFRTAESSSDRLVFTMPGSPDGRPGEVDIVLRVALDGVDAEITASPVFLFANPDPFFGPRGAVFDRLPLAIAPIPLDQAPSTAAAPDFAVLTEQGGVAFLQLLLAQQNGMFQPFGAPRQIGDHEVVAERGPRDLGVGDFDGDQIPDVFVVNEGAATALHHVVLGQARPLPPLGGTHRIVAAPGSWRCRVGTFDGDALPDVLLVPGPNAAPGQRPQVLLARPVAPGQPAFASPIELLVRSFPYEAVEVADLDGDLLLDIALASGVEGKLDVVYGQGNGAFTPAVELDFDVPGYTADPQSPAVGLHACRDGTQQSLGLVLAGLASSFPSGPTAATVTLLRQPAARSFVPPISGDTVQLPLEPIGRSLLADLDQVPPVELVLGMADEPNFVSLLLLQLTPAGFLPVDGGIEFGAESPRQIRALAFDRAFPASATSPAAQAVFIVHETDVDGVRERRLSTRLVVEPQPGVPRLLPPDAGGELGFRIEDLVAGDFHQISIDGAGAVRDLALVRTTGSAPTDAVVLIANDGFGGFARLGNRVDFAGLLPGSLVVLPTDAPGVADALVFAGRDSRLAIWHHDENGPVVQAPDAVTTALRALSPDPGLAAASLTSGTRLRVGDVDGDGVPDLVVLLVFDLPQPGEGQGALALLRGRPDALPGEFPFHLPSGLTPVHGASTAIALGDFTANGPGQVRRLELAVAVPTASPPGGPDGDHVRFFRYSPGTTAADDRLVPAAAGGGPQVLLAGSGPTELATDDVDGDGTIDLLVACRGDGTLRLFRNTAAVDVAAVAVDVGAFDEGLGSPWLLAPGLPTRLLLADVNGDGNRDATVLVEFAGIAGVRSTTAANYLSSGDGAFVGPRFLSRTRVGTVDGRLVGDLGDWNRDGVPDLLLGWDTSQAAFIDLRILFGGTR